MKLPPVKDIHIQADSLVKQIVTDFENELRLQANILAKEDEVILSNHVRQALVVVRREKSRKWKEELPILIGGTLLGTFLAGFANELSMATLRPIWIAVYVIFGFIGAFLIFLGFINQHRK